MMMIVIIVNCASPLRKKVFEDIIKVGMFS